MTPTSTPRPQISPSEGEAGKAYLLGQLDERKAVSRYLAVRAARAACHAAQFPWWAFYRRRFYSWAAAMNAITARDIEQAEHVTDQAVWVIDLKDGVIVGREAFRDSDRSGEAGETGTGSTEGESAGPEGIAHD